MAIRPIDKITFFSAIGSIKTDITQVLILSGNGSPYRPVKPSLTNYLLAGYCVVNILIK